jgi:hypothetical protein
MLASTKPRAEFSRGCARPTPRPRISTTHPLALDSRIDSEKRAQLPYWSAFMHDCGNGFARNPFKALWYFSPLLDTTAPASASLRSSATLRRWRGWVPKVVHGVFRPRSYPTRKRWRCASVFAEPLLTPPDSLEESHGQPLEIAQSLRRNLGMSGVDRLLVGFHCQVVLSAFLKEYS